MRTYHLLPQLMGILALAYRPNVYAQDPPALDPSSCPPLTSCDPTNSPPPTPPTSPPAAGSTAESMDQAAHIVDTVTSGTFLVPEAVAHVLQDTAAIETFKGPVGTTLGALTKGAAATTQIYKGYATEGSVGALREGTQVITDFTAEQVIIQGSTAVGGLAFGPVGAEAGEMVGKASTYAGSLIKKLPCGNTNVEGCVTDFEFDVYDHWRSNPQCDENGVCYDPKTGRNNMMPDSDGSLVPLTGTGNPTTSNSLATDEANRQQMEQEFDQLDSRNEAAAAQAAAQESHDFPSASADAPQPSPFDWLNLATGIPQSASPMPKQTKLPPPSPVSAIPAGWVPCSCPEKHAGFGRWFSGVLYHPEGPQC